MKKYNNIRIIDDAGKLIFEGSYTKLLNKFNNKEECNEFIEKCKEKGYDYQSRVCYYDFEYDNPSTGLSQIWFNDIMCNIGYENSRELIEEIIKLSFKEIKNVKCEYLGQKYLLVVLPKKYDSLILYRPYDIDHKFFAKLLAQIYLNINGRHNKTPYPKIRVIEFVNDWRYKQTYADYNEGYTFYYNSVPEENRLNLLLR